MKHPRTLVALVATLLAAPSYAHAEPTKAECSQAADAAQALRAAGKITAARASFRTCLAPSCPALIVHDCSEWLDQADKAQPSIVFAAKDRAGNDLSAVGVTVDGSPLSTRLDGEALDVDPGEHVFVLTSGSATVTRKLVILEGDKRRREIVVLESAAPAEVTTAAHSAWSAQAVAGVTLAGAGVAGVVVGSIFGGLAFSATHDSNTACASLTTCPSHAEAVTDHATATTDGAISTVAFIAGGVLVAGGATLYFTRAGHPHDARGTAVTVVPTFDPRGPGFAMSGSF